MPNYRLGITKLKRISETNNAQWDIVYKNYDLSNLASYIEDAIEIACNLSSYWNEGGFGVRQKIQNMVFPNGVKWDKENRAYLTDSGNLFFDATCRISGDYKILEAQKRGNPFRFPLR